MQGNSFSNKIITTMKGLFKSDENSGKFQDKEEKEEHYPPTF